MIPLWAFSTRGSGGNNTVPMVLGAVAAIAAVVLFAMGWRTMNNFRIEVQLEELRLERPSGDDLVLPWSQVQAIDVRGMAHDVSFGDGKGQALKWATQWEDLEVEMVDGQKHDIDLRPLSVEQRGTLWRAIARKADLHGQIMILPTSRR